MFQSPDRPAAERGASPLARGAAPARTRELARRARAGDREAFGEIVDRHYAALFRFLRVRAGNAADAEELCQESWLRAWQKLDAYDERWSFTTWLFTLAARITISRSRRARVATEPQGEDGLAHVVDERDGGPIGAASAAEDRRNLWELATEVLGPEQRTALWLCYGEGLGGAEIARILDRPASSVRVLLFRARERLGRSLREARATDPAWRAEGEATRVEGGEAPRGDDRPEPGRAEAAMTSRAGRARRRNER